jgi:uncharacterized protein (TIGR02598 family)
MPDTTELAQAFTSRPGRVSQGFSLVEVTIALGVVSFALVALFGLLPTGLTTFRSSIDRSVASQIAQGIINEARQTDFTNLGSLATASGSPKLFTEDGQETTDAAKSIYVAAITVEPGVAIPSATSFANSSMAKIRVRVANSPGGSETPITSNSTSVQDFTAFIPKM